MIQDEHDPQELLHALYPLAGGEANVAAAVRRGAKLTLTKALQTVRRWRHCRTSRQSA